MYKPNLKNAEQLLRLQKQLQSNNAFVVGLAYIPVADIEKATPKQALGEAVQQYLNAFFLKLVELYPTDAPEWRDKTKSFQLEQFRNYFLLDHVLSFLRFDDTPRLLAKSELEQLLYQTRLMPAVADWFPAALKSLRGILDDLFTIRDAVPEDIWKQLYMTEMRMRQELQLVTISRQQILRYLDSYTRQQLSRLNAGRRRRLQWGQELEEYYQEERQKGLHERMALIASRQRFKLAHPPVVDPGDADGISPGLTAASLGSYHAAYLESIGRK